MPNPEMPRVPLEVQNEELSALVLAWAKANEPNAYGKTIKVAINPIVFHNYLLRLVELRYAADREFRLACPIRILDETALTIRLKDKNGIVHIFNGEKCKHPLQNRIRELGLNKQQFIGLQQAKRELDLEYVAESE